MATSSFPNLSGLTSADSPGYKFMSSPSKFLHLRHAFLLAVLSLTLTLAARSDPAPPAATPPVPAPAADATNAPATDTKQPVPDAKQPPATDIPAATDEQPDDNPVQLPAIKPIFIHAERDADIGHMVGELLEQNHYLQKPISPEISQRWLKNYCLALDPTHLFFLQSDIDEFTTRYGNNLGELLLHADTDDAAIAPAFEIFNRYLQRVDENVHLADKAPARKGTTSPRTRPSRLRTNKSIWFKDKAESEAIWRGQVKSDLLKRHPGQKIAGRNGQAPLQALCLLPDGRRGG